MINRNHPFYFLMPLFCKHEAIFSLSRYVYTPDSLFDDREDMSVRGEELTPERINQEIELLRPDQELAFNSNVRIGEKNFHIPMIDFSAEEKISGEIFNRISCYLPKALLLNMAIYNSGRSFHAYSMKLLTRKEWIEFMGRLLLVNPRGHADIVDSRWVGHRLIGGFGALRWSNNSGQYQGLPSRIPFP